MPNDVELFGREIRVVVGDIDVTGLRAGFTIEKTLKRQPNSARVSVWNLSAEHREALEGREGGVPVSVEAGYSGGLALVFLGELDEAHSERERADWVTTVSSSDGKQSLNARAAKSWRGGVSVTKVLQDLAESMGVGIGNVVQVIKSQGASLDSIGSAFKAGFAAPGGPQEAIERLLRDTDVEVSVQDGELQAHAAGQAATTTAVVLDRSTGLVGNPAVDRKGRLQATALMQHGLNPGALVQVESTTASGLWRVDHVTYEGDTFRPEWYAQIEGRPLA